MTSGWILLISFVAIAAGIAAGMLLRQRLGEERLESAKEMIRLGASFLATLSAVLISLMIASAKSSYDTQDSHFRQLAAYLVETDRLLSQYGPESKQVRLLMRQAMPAPIDRIWREKQSALQDSAFTSASLAEQLNGAIAALTPADDAQRALKLRIELAGAEIARTRLLMFSDGEPAILTPFLLILIVWLAVVFVSYSLFVEPGRIVVAALLVFALSISSALFLVADLSQPFVGLMQLPKEQLRQTLGPLD
ncbi:hypothetical protein [Bradyrhizobium sp.]|uniref:bestrophin-like domain n=1 Tax=Bradyrhizobium sp. TaxID=376 RepID=UPI002CB1CA15|nr:hypothetical protein [Bradyrhizobium sp.]HWX60589.1 hypothetical protein [Bradyrhizobium sp.]